MTMTKAKIHPVEKFNRPIVEILDNIKTVSVNIYIDMQFYLFVTVTLILVLKEILHSN